MAQNKTHARRRRRSTPATVSAGAQLGKLTEFAELGLPGVKTERAWVGDAPHAMRDQLGLKAGVYRACGLEIKDGGAPVRRRIAGAGAFGHARADLLLQKGQGGPSHVRRAETGCACGHVMLQHSRYGGAAATKHR